MVREIEANSYYTVEISEPEGNNGYFRNVPKILVQAKCMNIKYQIRSNSGAKIKGDVTTNKMPISDTIQGDGDYRLELWAEDYNGRIVEDSVSTQKIVVDSGTDQDAISFIWDESSRRMEIAAKDKLSGVEEIYYRIGDGAERFTRENPFFVTVPREFFGEIKVTLVDRAGNQCKAAYKVEDVQVKEPTKIPSTAPIPSTVPTVPEEARSEELTSQVSEKPQAEQQNQETIIDKTPPKIINSEELEESLMKLGKKNYEAFDIEEYVEDESVYFCGFVKNRDTIELRITDCAGNQTVQQIPMKSSEMYWGWLMYIPIILFLFIFCAWKLWKRRVY